ncbi:hypothetical protein AKJ38_00215 [candidate division MSBL1 archaeon SCGC-AAA259I14]|uniref:Aldehyde ferredoxin oxidoreductase N-terminal domain-containing protein n=1 Tax=candidate division MSBL1 archaeon SCGC-AAA259I14 TaxID=1698268 RepID=A0A133UU90_9EURY|nr:hypothetical protein AKJ38_00215 [candidate division MSBL1 archaeon SCGC-AAA259I14]
MYSYAGKILRINLDKKKITTEPTSKYSEKFLGGRGINQWLLFKETNQSTSPLDPECPIIFGTGVLLGTLTIGACRYNVDSLNYLTGGVGSSNSGGHFGPELKFAGYDHLLIKGKNPDPCYLWIDGENVEIRDAEGYWGKTTWDADSMIRKELGDEDIQLATIGPAGENLVRGACIINNGARAAGRCGLGGVMGSKNLKSIAVRGDDSIEVADTNEFLKLSEEILKKIEKDLRMDSFKTYGTMKVAQHDNDNWSGCPVRNFQDGYWDKSDRIRCEDLVENYSVKNIGCFACPVSCSHWLKISNGDFEGTTGEGFQTNTINNFGYKLNIDNWPAIIKAHVLCSQYGLDVDNTAGSIAWAAECYQRGILDKKDLDGLDLEWDNQDAILELIRKIAMREGIGDLLAEGSKRASEKIGGESQKYAIHMKKQELYETLRYRKGWALGVAVSPRGGGHLRGAPAFEGNVSPEDAEKFYGVKTASDRNAYEGKAKIVTWMENFKAILDSVGICALLSWWKSPHLVGPEDVTRLLEAATGKSWNVRNLLKTGERIHNVEKAINSRAGFTRLDDIPPERFFEEPIKSGPGKGDILERDKFEQMLNEYYQIRGWNIQTSLPTSNKLKELDLEKVAEELEKHGKLG